MPAQAGGGTKPWQGWESGAREEVRQFLRALRIGLLDGRVLSHVTMWCAGLNKDWNPGNSFPPQSPDQGSALVDGLIIVFCDQVSPGRLQLSVFKKDSNPKDLICTIAAAMLRNG